jgi:hypothetical protein
MQGPEVEGVAIMAAGVAVLTVMEVEEVAVEAVI